MATQKRPNLAASSVSILVLVAGALIALNVIAGYTNVGRIDLTANRLWSLSDGSRDLVSDLGDRMEITAYFTENLPPPFNSTEQYVRDILDEYSAASGGKVVVRFVNPDEDEEREAAEADGIQRVAHQKIENDAVSVVEGYRGLVIRYLGETKTIPVIQDPTGLEYTITMAIKELVGEKTTVGILSDVGQATGLIRERLRAVDTLFIEANYDETMLVNDTRRPWATKQRISSRHGHLSNDQAAELIVSVATERLHRVVLGHLSSDCNAPEVAIRVISRELEKAGWPEVSVECADRKIPLPLRETAKPRPPAQEPPNQPEIALEDAVVR